MKPFPGPLMILLAAWCVMGCGPPQEELAQTRRITLRIEHIGGEGTFTGTMQQDVVLALAPGVFTVSRAPDALFAPGAPASPELEALAEAGDPSLLLEAMRRDERQSQVSLTGDIDNADYEESPILPGKSTLLFIDYAPGEKLAMAMMLGPSNDTFLGTPQGGLDLEALSEGELDATTFVWWDAGTEVNEPIGEGAYQLPGTMGTEAGEEQGDTIKEAALMTQQGTKLLPEVAEVIRITVTRR